MCRRWESVYLPAYDLDLSETKSHGHCNGHNLANGTHLSAKLCEGNRMYFPTRLVEGNVFPQPTCGKRPSASRQPERKCCDLEVNSFACGRRNF